MNQKIAERVASDFIRTSKRMVKTQFMAKVTLIYDSDADSIGGRDNEHDAQQAFLDKVPNRLGKNVILHDLRITEGFVDERGIRSN